MDLKPVDFSKVECCFVYCYLREKDHTPYYVGLASRGDRVTAHHTVHIPPNRANIRVLRSGLTKEEAQEWERQVELRPGASQVEEWRDCSWLETLADVLEERLRGRQPQWLTLSSRRWRKPKANKARYYAVPWLIKDQ